MLKWALLVVVLAVPAQAGELAGVTLPDQIDVDGTRLVLNGLGLREATVFKVDVYVGALYLERRSSDPDAILSANGPRRTVMHFLRRVKRKDIVKAWREGVAKSAPRDPARYEPQLTKLNSWMSDMEPGDTLTFTYQPAKGTEVRVRGDVKGTIEGASFGKVLWGVWIGPVPPNAGLKSGMLGLK